MDMDNKKNSKAEGQKINTTRFLYVSFGIIVIICVGVLALFAKVTNESSADTINEIGTIYMEGMNERIAMHFEATIESRMSRVKYLAESFSPEEADADGYEAMKETLSYGAKARNLTHLALYTEDGQFEMLLGEPIELADQDPFLESVMKGEEKIAAGKSRDGEEVVVMGVPAEYPMKNGGKSVALTGAFTVDYLKQLLALDNDYSLVYSHIIRHDGSFVIRTRDVEEDNYFDLITDYFVDNDGRSPEVYVEELKAAMEAREDYSALFYLENDRRHLYCTALPFSEWYLITVMPYGSLDEAINELENQRFVLLLSGIGIILCVLLIIFVMYFRLTRKQILELEESRRAAVRASKAKSEFLSNMSHDIRTPMNAILGMTAIATANIDNKAQVQDCLKKITMSGKHLLGLINDILDMSKIESGKLTLTSELVSLPEIMDGIVNIVQPQINEKRQQFDIFIHDINTENVYCDSVRLNQVLLNLLSNAVKFTPEGGSVSISLLEENSPAGEAYVRVHLYVKDTGIGMSQEFIEKLYDSFTREDDKRVHRTEGAGLGMAITKHIVDAMDGSIEVKSELGKGTEFHVIFDLEKAAVQEEDMILPDWRMLLVDDDEELCVSTRASLESIGLKADWALDGMTAIEMAENSHKNHKDYQIILIDWKMPGIDGIETARRMRNKMGDDVPILLISAYDWSNIEQEAREAGVTGFISKPLFRSTLFYGLRQYTDQEAPAVEQNPGCRTDFGGIRVLIAEDNELNWEIANELLSQFGLKLEWAENGQICVDKFMQSPAGYYSAVLMDIRMPVMTGYEAAAAIRGSDRTDRDIPIIAMTADAFSEDIKKCLACGMNAHVAKPIDVKEVVRLLDKYIIQTKEELL
ncbi:MAG: response regulator [Eubacteriales bacterium]|nr:response regulator [Eubacteriales bacterium]